MRPGELMGALGLAAMTIPGMHPEEIARRQRADARRRARRGRRGRKKPKVQILADGARQIGKHIIQPGITSRACYLNPEQPANARSIALLEARKAPPAPGVLEATNRARRARRDARKRAKP